MDRFPKALSALALSLACSLCRPARAAELTTPANEAKIDALIAQMTVAEKVGQLNQLASDTLTGPGRVVSDGDMLIKKGSVGSLFNAVKAPKTNAFQKEAVEDSRLHIPLLFGYDVIHGFTTLFPIPLGLSSSWDPGLVEQTSRFAAEEASAQGVRWTFSPMVDIARDPRWGRITEGAGEDTFLGSAFARAYVRGYQGTRLDDRSSVVACAKHFVGYGAVEGGREYNSTEISERTLRDVYLPPFQAAVDEGAGTLMAAFNAIDGVPSSANHFTLTTVLRDEWKFQGLVGSDWTAIQEIVLHGIADDENVAARKAFMAGVDMDMQSTVYLAQLPSLVASGKVPMERLDEAVRRVLRVKFALGLFDHPYVPVPAGLSVAEKARGLELARRAAEESFVLLENHPVKGTPLLPLKPPAGMKIGLIGPLADDAADMLGSWTGVADSKDVVTLKTSLSKRAALGEFTLTVAGGTDVGGTKDDGFARAVEVAKQSDVVILTLGEGGHSSGEAAARSHIDLPGNQERLLEKIVATGTPVVLVVFSGRPLSLPWASKHVPAVLEAWFPGLQAGPALARTLFGEVSPSARLTVSVPRSVGQIPIYYNHLNTGRPRTDLQVPDTNPTNSYFVTGYIDEKDGPLYPFGYGLGYTSFEYSAVSVDAQILSAAAINSGEAHLTVTATVRNKGPREGTDVAQLYIRMRGTSVARPIRELKGFKRLHLAPGESQKAEFTIGRDELSFWNLDMKYVAEAGTLFVWVAPDSEHGSPARIEIRD
ncbi:MAG TPA: glycoside hydrolase family 3 N-terminal domain-containing protein [Opitutaceae bacterium]|nr:glycoside hydrolase family 3 N-terminal domain-containing protein [Opitutaceae bacterium]